MYNYNDPTDYKSEIERRDRNDRHRAKIAAEIRVEVHAEIVRRGIDASVVGIIAPYVIEQTINQPDGITYVGPLINSLSLQPSLRQLFGVDTD